VNPLRYTGNMGITGTLGVGRGELPNAKTVMSVYPAVGGQDSLQVWRRSNGSPVAWIDSTGAFRTLSINGPGYSGGIDNVGSVRGRRFRSDTNGTADLPVIWSANGTQNTGPFWLDNGTGDGRSSRWAIAAKGAQVAVFDSSGVDVTGDVDATGNVTGANLMYKADFRDSLTAALALEQLLPLPDFADTTISAQDSVTVKLLADIDGGKGRNKKVVAYGNGTTAVDSLTLVSTFSPLTQYADTLVVWIKTADNTNTLFSVQIRDNDGAVLFSSGKIQVGADDTMTRFAWALSDFATVDEKMLLYGVTLQNAADVMELGQAYIKRIQ